MKGWNLVLYTYSLSFIANLAEKLNFIFWHEHYQAFNVASDYGDFEIFFFSQMIGRGGFCFVYGGFVSFIYFL